MGMLEQQQQQQAMGQVDQTSPEAQADPNVITQATPQAGMKTAQAEAGNQSSVMEGAEQATPEEQGEYEQALAAMHIVMYGNEKSSDKIVDMLQAEDKIGSTAKAGMMVISQLDAKLDLNEDIIAELTGDVANNMVELAEQGKGFQYSEKELQAVLGSTWEGVMQIYGVDENQYAGFTEGMSDEQMTGYQSEYQGYLGNQGGQ
jgi:hypothetical protein